MDLRPAFLQDGMDGYEENASEADISFVYIYHRHGAHLVSGRVLIVVSCTGHIQR